MPIAADLFKKALAKPPEIVGVMLPSVGIKVYVRQLPPEERGGLQPSADELREPIDHRARVLSACLCYHDGSQDFDAAAADVIKNAQPGELASVYTAACHMNGVKALAPSA